MFFTHSIAKSSNFRRPASTTRMFLAGGLAFTLVASACGDSGNSAANSSNSSTSSVPEDVVETVVVNGDDIELTSGLAAFDNCDRLLSHLQTEGAERVGPYGFNNGNYHRFDIMRAGGEVVEAMEDDESSDADVQPSSNSSDGSTPGKLTEGEDFSGTNNQEDGVDEPDYVKTDGSRILTMTQGVFTYVDIDGDEATIRGSLRLDHQTQEMLIVGDTAYLFGTSYGEEIYFEDDVARQESTDAEAHLLDDIALPSPRSFHGPTVSVIELDISSADSPTVVSTLKVEGHYLSARKVGNTISVALQSDQHDLGFVFPQGSNGEDAAERVNREIVAETDLADWLPSYSLRVNDDTTSGQLTDCANVHAPQEFSGFGSLSVLTIDGESGLDTPGAASVLASGQNVYASSNSMWISTNQWYDWEILDENERAATEDSYTTQIHGFEIGSATPEYLASGTVRGHLLNQFSLSEYDGVLRVASTDGSPWGAGQDSESFVTTFDIAENELRQLGQVGDMGKGEQIFAVRFVGEVGYVVTFRQTDPFYTVDLSDPANPQVLGELKITGFSGQLHPLGPDHVLGIGQEATNEGRTTGAKVTLFDVSDLANPIDVANWTVDNSWSDAQWDHKAFLWWPQENLAVLPVQNWQEQFFGAVAFRIDLDEGTITEAGRIEHLPDENDRLGQTDCDVLAGDIFEQFIGQDSELGMVSEEMQFFGAQGQLQDCGDGETGATGYHCEPWDWVPMSDAERDAIGIEGTLEFCWLDGPGEDPVVRTIVIGDTLWSLSWSRLQANDLSTLDAGGYVSLG